MSIVCSFYSSFLSVLYLLFLVCVLAGFQRDIPGFGGRYSVIGDDSTEYNLQIINTNLGDDDDFHCQVMPMSGNPPLTAKAHLTVLGKIYRIIIFVKL